MTSFWKKLMGRRDDADNAGAHGHEHKSVDDVAADEVVEERLGGTDPQRLVDDEFKP